MDEATTLGPGPRKWHLYNPLGQVEGAVAKGATVVMGGKRIDRPGAFMQATDLANIKPDNPAFREEFIRANGALFSESRTRKRRSRSPTTRISGWEALSSPRTLRAANEKRAGSTRA